MKSFSPTHWKEYELIDCGNYEKIERFGDYVLIRPETNAHWPPKMNRNRWKEMAHVQFKYKSKKSGTWEKLKSMPNQWEVNYPLKQGSLKFKLALTAFKHLGIFPEQATNWDFIAEKVEGFEGKPKVLNLFAYTGGASLAANAAGADVTHVDSIRQVVTWTKENMELSELDGIRWVIEDALKFVNREVKRGNKYNGIIMDPPSFGLGAKGEKWKLEDKINELLKGVNQICAKNHFVVLNTYSGLSPLTVEQLVRSHFQGSDVQVGEIFLSGKSNSKLPLGSVARITSR